MGAFKQQAVEFAERFDAASDAIERLVQDEPEPEPAEPEVE